MGIKDEEYLPLFETNQAKGRLINKVFIVLNFMAIFMVWIYRIIEMPSKYEGRWVWVGLFVAEIWFSFYWILTKNLRWNLIYRRTFKDRLSKRYRKNLPKVDIFVCTADPVREPPTMVINTVLSVMAYDYPPEKLSVYLSDDGCSILTFYALLEASHFSKHWLPFCRKHNVEPRSPIAYFNSMPKPLNANHARDFASIKEMYHEMQNRIEASTTLGHIPKEAHDQHKGFFEWKTSYNSKSDHDTIVQFLINGRDSKTKDIEGCNLPTLIYLAREKRPQHFHNFKAGAMNALIRVSSKISNGPVILNVDCDMYCNNSQSIRDALCFFMDEKQSQGIAFVQFPQKFENTTKNDLYGTSLHMVQEVELAGLDALGGPCYIGTGCFHQREILCGRNYSKDYKFEEKMHNFMEVQGTLVELEEQAKALSSCTYEYNSQWGKEIGLKYGCAVEDILTGLGIHSKGWKSVYLNPKRAAFLGVAPTSLMDTLVQHNRWTSGWNEIMVYHSYILSALGKVNLRHLLGYLHYNLWACNCFAILYYCLIPSLYLLKGIPLFPEISSNWFIPFIYIIIAENSYSLGEFLYCNGTILGWWNEQRIWLYKRASSYLFAVTDTLLKLCGYGNVKFVITSKVADEDVSTRYENEVMEFGVDSPMFVILETLALVNVLTFVLVTIKVVKMVRYEREMVINKLALQILLCGVLVLINLPLYKGVLIRRDNGKMPNFVNIKATCIALLFLSLVLF